MRELMLVAVAVLLLPAASWQRARMTRRVPDGLRGQTGVAAGALLAGWLFALPWWVIVAVTVGAVIVVRRLAGRQPAPTPEQRRAVAATFDLVAACLDAGLTPAAALHTCAGQPGVPDRLAREMREISAVLALGGETPRSTLHPELALWVTGLHRSVRGGVRLAEVAREIAAHLRAEARSREATAAARAGIAMTAPLALCFLPAFLCLGLAPVVIGLIGSLQIW